QRRRSRLALPHRVRWRVAWCRSSTCAGQDARIFPACLECSVLELFAFVLQDVQSGIRISEVHQPVDVNEHIAGLYDFSGVRPLVDDSLRRRRDEIADLFWLILIA